jgi:hypothetical protein
MEPVDWLYDPLTIINKSYLYSKAGGLDNELNAKWAQFHWATRVKLEGLDYFCRQITGAASMPIDVGLYKMSLRLIVWNLDAFFFEMVAAHDRVIQELNIVYGNTDALNPASVSWDSIKGRFQDRMPINLVNYIDTTIKEDWFKKVIWYRDAATQLVAIRGKGSFKHSGPDEKPWNWYDWEQSINYIDGDTGEIKEENIKQCVTYLKHMVEYVTRVWNEMSNEFDKT